MSATLIQYGLTNKRINREPIDAESVLTTYSQLSSYCGSDSTPDANKGHFYDGFITSIITSEKKYSPEHYDSIPNYKVSYAGPWYIRNSYVGGKGSYTGDRILTNSEIKSYIGYVVTYIGTGGGTQTEYVKYVSTFQDVTGDEETLYYLDTEYGNYSIGFYRYKNNNFELIYDTSIEYVKYVSTFQGITGDAETLYYLDTEYSNYSIGFYRYKNNNFELIGGTNITWGNLT